MVKTAMVLLKLRQGSELKMQVDFPVLDLPFRLTEPKVSNKLFSTLSLVNKILKVSSLLVLVYKRHSFKKTIAYLIFWIYSQKDNARQSH